MVNAEIQRRTEPTSGVSLHDRTINGHRLWPHLHRQARPLYDVTCITGIDNRLGLVAGEEPAILACIPRLNSAAAGYPTGGGAAAREMVAGAGFEPATFGL